MPTTRWYDDHDRLHRDNDLPAVIYLDGSNEWYRHGMRHRDNNLAAVIWPEAGYMVWYKNDLRHRENGPARITENTQEWYIHGNQIDVDQWIKNNKLSSYETWDNVTWALFRLEFL